MSRVGVLLLALGAAALPSLGAAQSDGALPSVLQRRVEAGTATGAWWAAGEPLRAVRALPSFYRARAFQPAWVGGANGTVHIDALLDALDGAAGDGLDPDDYHRARIRELRRAGPVDVDARADLDLLATDAFLLLGSHLLHGRVDPVRVQAEWLADRRGADMATVLAEALEAGDVGAALDALRPPQARYRIMREALASLRSAAGQGGWPTVGPGPTIGVGDRDPRVPALRRRLVASGDLDGASGLEADGDLFDAALEEAVRRFQVRHGLEVDGRVGAGTVAALDVPVERRMEQLAINLERWRWLPADLGSRHVLVNIPDYSVVVRERGEVALRLRGIVGREYRQTPVFSGRMTYLVLSPFWHVPPGIAANDKFPAIRADPGYVRAQNMTLLDQRTNGSVDPSSVDWGSLTAAQFNQRFRLRQDPGPANALGDVKFMFPNPHNVYLHDTPSRELFARTDRSFSSGCIRVERPLELAAYLLGGLPGWNPQRIRSTVDRRVETTVTLPEAVPVHLQYWTAFVDDDGRLNYRRDLYQRDDAVLNALRADPPGL